MTTRCSLCGRQFEDHRALIEHEVNEWIAQWIQSEHPEWRRKDGACPECWNQLDKLVLEADKLQVDATEREPSRPRRPA